MPILNIRVETKKKGKSVPAPSGLAENGPLMQVRVTAPDAHVEALKQKGKPVPSVDGHVMIDTGAMRTAIDIDVARKIGLPVIGRSRCAANSSTLKSKDYAT